MYREVWWVVGVQLLFLVRPCLQLQSVPSTDLLLQDRVDQSVLFDHGYAVELVTDNVDGIHRAAATRDVTNVKH